ncbi:hypothetical protein GCM10008022_16750 [Paenibacillus hunanensis]|nr:hypothetical protein GCM10008022_16750 [Paenibacillus hunanensis]
MRVNVIRPHNKQNRYRNPDTGFISESKIVSKIGYKKNLHNTKLFTILYSVTYNNNLANDQIVH